MLKTFIATLGAGLVCLAIYFYIDEARVSKQQIVLTVPQVSEAEGKAKFKFLMTEAQTKQVGQYLEQFQLRYNRFPESLGELSCQSTRLRNCVPLAKEEELKDAWGNNFIYQTEYYGQKYRIWSLGADGKEGGDKYDADLSATGP